MENVLTKDISVVIQGPIFHNIDPTTGKEWTSLVADSIRHFLPAAEIILSTWKDEDISGIDCDFCVLNDDPGFTPLHGIDCLNLNTNRQLVSTYNGIKQATRKYVLKTRTESYLTGRNFIDIFGQFEERCDEYHIVQQRIVVSGYANPYITKRPFYMSDMYFFGLKEDLLNFWNISLVPAEGLTITTKTGSGRVPRNAKLHNGRIGNIPVGSEQYYLKEFINKYLASGHSVPKESLFRVSDKVIANNFIVMDEGDGNGILSFKYPNRKRNKSNYCLASWKILYKKYCENHYKVAIKDIIAFYINTTEEILKYGGVDIFREYFPNTFAKIREVLTKCGFKLHRV